MGHEVEVVARARGHEVVAVIDPVIAGPAGVPTNTAVTQESIDGAQAVIEFSQARAVVDNVRVYAQTGVSAVVGTTGWNDEIETVRNIVSKSDIGVVAGSNFSIGAHLFFALATEAARLASNLDEYDLFIHEMHHRGKKDSPSGTALNLAEKIIAVSPLKKTIQVDRLSREPRTEELHVTSTRGGAIPGVHTLYLDSAADTIEVRHSARNRSGFALGAVRAAEWVVDQRGFFTVDDFVRSLLHSEGGGR